MNKMIIILMMVMMLLPVCFAATNVIGGAAVGIIESQSQSQQQPDIPVQAEPNRAPYVAVLLVLGALYLYKKGGKRQ